MAEILAILFSPVIAVLVTLWFEKRKDRRATKLWILTTLVSTRHIAPPSDEQVRALNMIDIAFRKSAKVRGLWHEYFGMLNNQGMFNELGYAQRTKKYLEMLTAMAGDVGYGHTITALDIDRVYSPVSLGKRSEREQAISDELLRVLKGSQGLAVTPLATADPTPPLLPPGR